MDCDSLKTTSVASMFCSLPYKKFQDSTIMTQEKALKNDLQTIRELEKAVAEADALATQKSNFLATMSHEIRTPMQTIFGLLELISEEELDGNVSSMVQTAQNAASGLLEILDDVLDVAKMDADAMELDLFEVPVRLLAQGLIEALLVKVRGGHVKLSDDIAPDVPFVILGDPKRLRQILMNLCSNALKFTDTGHVTLHIDTNTQHIHVPDDGMGLRFEIIDTGIGMDQETCDKLFQSFTQADNTTSRKYGGTGLGLSISKKLVELMNGKIGVTSEKGKGSVFWFEIPTEEISTDESRINLPDLQGLSVLSVEDHPQGAKEIVNSLRSMGAKVEHCTTYKEGLELSLNHPFDVAVIDQGLPDGLGLDLIRDIMKHRPFMGFVMYTVRDDVGLSHSLSSLGVTYLTKPASRAGLGEAIKGAARRHANTIEGETRLLIAEDTDSVRDILRRQLEKLNIEADFVSNGQEALDANKTGKYSILITDLHMPVLDGYDLVKAIRAEDADTQNHTPVIALTADVQMSQREAYARHGFDECLVKPVTLGHLRGLLIRWHLLDESHMQAQKTSSNFDKYILPAATQSQSIDHDCLIAHIGEINENTIEMMHMFMEMTQPLVDEIGEAYQQKNFTALFELGHSLKGSARSACCNILGDLAQDLEDQAERKDVSSQLIDKIKQEFTNIENSIEDLKLSI
ncbi:MAG: response regulator [Alphaproteobacteria bacterium]